MSPRFKRKLEDCSQLTLVQRGEEGSTSERIWNYGERRPGEFNTNKRTNTGFVVLFGVRKSGDRGRRKTALQGHRDIISILAGVSPAYLSPNVDKSEVSQSYFYHISLAGMLLLS